MVGPARAERMADVSAGRARSRKIHAGLGRPLASRDGGLHLVVLHVVDGPAYRVLRWFAVVSADLEHGRAWYGDRTENIRLARR